MGFLASLIPGFIKDGLGMVNDHFDAKRKLKQAQVANEIAIGQAKVRHVIKTAETKQTADIDWDIQAIKNAQNSWADEWFVILLSIPAIMCFIPGGAPIVASGFSALSLAPDWYLGAFGIAVAASFGVRKFGNKMIERIKS